MKNMGVRVYSKGIFEVIGAKDDLKIEIMAFKYKVNPNIMGLGCTTRRAIKT